MAKKKKSRVTPTIPQENIKYPLYDNLQDGDAFLFQGALFVKCENSDQQALDLDTGYIEENMCGKVIEPVDIVITWKKK